MDSRVDKDNRKSKKAIRNEHDKAKQAMQQQIIAEFSNDSDLGDFGKRAKAVARNQQ